jgi:uncharacterized protein (TIGR04222 family)
MDQPWRLSGAPFLWAYGAGVCAVLLISWTFWQFLRGLPRWRPARHLNLYEMAYLAGGKRRVAEVVIAGLVDLNALRVDSRGTLTPADRTALIGPFAAAGAQIPPWGMRTDAARDKIGDDPGVRAIGARLTADGLVIASARLSALWWVSGAMTAALLVTGGARLLAGKLNHRPIDDLLSLVMATIVIAILAWARIYKSSRATRHGKTVLKRLRKAPLIGGIRMSRAVVAGAAFARETGPAMGAAALFGIALWGFTALPDDQTRAALLAGLPSCAGRRE